MKNQVILFRTPMMIAPLVVLVNRQAFHLEDFLIIIFFKLKTLFPDTAIFIFFFRSLFSALIFLLPPARGARLATLSLGIFYFYRIFQLITTCMAGKHCDLIITYVY